MDKPQPKFKRGDTVRVKELPHSELNIQSHDWNPLMDSCIGKTLTIDNVTYGNNTNARHNGRERTVWLYKVRENSWTFEEYVLEPYTDNYQLVWI